MMQEADAIVAHYSSSDLSAKVLSALTEAGKDVSALTLDDLKSFDEFHIRGREATEELATLARLEPDIRVVDLGSGVGGPARWLASKHGYRVTGVDLVPEYCDVANMLANRVGLAGRASFIQSDMTSTPLESGSFEGAWTQHSTMNVRDKVRLLREIRRLLVPAGAYAFNEICSGATQPVLYPVPWAGDAEISFLLHPDEFKALLTREGFAIREWSDTSVVSVEWYDRIRGSNAPPPPRPNLRLLLGETTTKKVDNMIANLREDRIRVIMGVAVRSDMEFS